MCVTRTNKIDKNMKELDPRLKEVGESLKKARIQRDLSQDELGDKLGVDHTTVGRYEKGELDMPLSRLFHYGDICDYIARVELEEKSTNDGIDDLMDLLEEEIGKTSATVAPKKTVPKVKISENTKRHLADYKSMKEDSRISKKTLKSLKNDIVEIVIEENKFDKEAMVRRLSAYAKYLKK